MDAEIDFRAERGAGAAPADPYAAAIRIGLVLEIQQPEPAVQPPPLRALQGAEAFGAPLCERSLLEALERCGVIRLCGDFSSNHEQQDHDGGVHFGPPCNV